MIPFFLFTLLAIAVQGLFALFEMAAVSFNRVRLQYYVSIGKKRALWLNHLLKRPSRLFGTTLIGISAALQIGSECSRRFYESIHLDPDWAPVTQILLVVIFAELSPLFAARRHPEQVAMTLIPLMSLLSRLFSPLIFAFDALSHLVHRVMGRTREIPLFLSREEVKMAFEEKEEDEFQATVRQIFQLKNLTAAQLMTPLSGVQMISSTLLLSELFPLLKTVPFAPFIPVYHRSPQNIVAVIQLRDLLRFDEKEKMMDLARSPWFVTKETSILKILDQFRRNNQSVAVILDPLGHACGLLTLDQIVAYLFGEELGEPPPEEPTLFIERTLAGDMLISEFNRQFQSDFSHAEEETLSDLITREADHPPVKGEVVEIGSFSFTVLELSLRGVKMLSVHSLQE